MNTWSDSSAQNLDTSHFLMQQLFNEVLKYHDCSVIYGFRSNEKQAEMFAEGKSKVGPGKSLHNLYPSLAVDVIPYIRGVGRITGNKPSDLYYFYHFAGVVKTLAAQKHIPVRWGGDWDGDGNFFDQTFNDLYHWEIPRKFELIGEKDENFITGISTVDDGLRVHDAGEIGTGPDTPD